MSRQPRGGVSLGGHWTDDEHSPMHSRHADYRRAPEAVATIDYEIRVAGDLPPEALADLRAAHLSPQGVETVLRGPVPDQAALVGIINWLQLMGVELREVRQAGPGDSNRHGR